MIQQCQKCLRGKMKTISRSHSHRGTIRHQKPNLQFKTLNGKRMLLCTRCIKALAKATV